MNLQTHIRPELWLAIQSTYEAGNYSHAVLDAMHYLTDLLREKSGVDGDGASLVGQALGGDAPRLRVNKLQTDTERDIQRGLQDILRGLYRAIRNPRSHEQVEDSKDEADAVIHFIGHLLGILAESKPPFVRDEFLLRVFDPDFVQSTRYAELLADEIPSSKRLDTLIALYRRKHEGNPRKLRYMCKAILENFTDDETDNFLSVVADELRSTREDKDVRVSLAILPPDLWPKVDETARLRVEYKLINSINEGEINPSTGELHEGRGALGTWARDLLKHFISKTDAWQALDGRMEGGIWSRAYVAKHFFCVLPHVYEATWKRDACINMICQAVENEEVPMRQALVDGFWDIPDDWRDGIEQRLQEIDPELLEGIRADTLPF